MCIRDLDTINLIWQLDFRLEPIFDTAPAASKNATYFKSGIVEHINLGLKFMPQLIKYDFEPKFVILVNIAIAF